MADPSIAPSGSPMSKLSIEILLRITFWLKTPDLCNMRLTCHSIERCLYDSFVGEFIARKQFMITPFSLQALVDLTESPVGAHLRRLQLGTDVLYPNYLWSATDSLQDKGSQLMNAQRICTRDGSHRRLLVQAFKNIKRHRGEDFEVVVRDFNSKRRTRDASKNRSAEWSSYGAVTAEGHGLRVVKSHPKDADFQSCSLTDIFRDVLICLADAGVQASGIETMARYGDFLSDKAFFMNPVETGVPKVLGGLKKLHLTLGVQRSHDLFHCVHGEESLEEADETKIMAYDTLPALLSHCHSLKELRLNQQQWNNPHTEAFLLWLSKPASANVLTPTPPMDLNLETLSIGMTQTRPNTLFNILAKFLPSLKSIELWRVTLCVPFPEASVADTPEPTLWKDLIIRLANQDLKLEHIMVGNASESYQTGEHVHIMTAVSRHVAFDGKNMHEYRGFDARNALLKMSQSIGPGEQDSLEKFKKRLSLHLRRSFGGAEDEDEDEDEDMSDDDDDNGDEDEDDEGN